MKELIKFLNESPNAFLAIENIAKVLKDNGYIELDEKKKFNIKKGNKYFVTRNGSSIIAFNVGKSLKDPCLLVSASHDDCPSFKLKPESIIYQNGYLKLNTEVYGGALLYPWLDRPLSIAGRLIVKDKKGNIKAKNYDYSKPFCIIPSVAIHLNREANTDLKLNPQIDMLPICGLEEKNLLDFLKKETKENILNYDLYLYPTQSAYVWGMKNEFISSYHLDDLQCAYASLKGFINNFNDDNINIYCCFDNEEVGSLTRQGADSNYFESILKRICDSLKLDYYELLANGMLLSCDNGHAVHPNHPEKTDINNNVKLNKGIVIKYNANQSYTSDALSSAIFKDLLDKEKIPYQFYTNRSDIRGGSTLGNLSNGHVSLLSIDIGLAQLAMHSPLETSGTKDYNYLVDAIKAFYQKHLKDNNLR